jgi:hypothetical protein
VSVKGWNHVAIEFPAFGTLLAASTANIYVEGSQVADTSTTGAYRRIVDEGVYSAGAAIADWEVPSTEGDRIYICRPAARFDNIKVVLSTAATDGISCTIHVHN